MKGQIICLLVVNLIFIWGGANGSDAFDDVASHLMEKRTLRFDVKNHERGSYEPFKLTAKTYAQKFKRFLRKFNNGNRSISQQFAEFDRFAWEGHYITKVYLGDRLRKEISLNGTPFQNVHSDIINLKNRLIVKDIQLHFSNWSLSILVHSNGIPDTNMETIRVLYTEALLVLEDMNPIPKEFEVYLVYFYQTLKRLEKAEVIHQDSFMLAEYLKLVNKHFSGIGFTDNVIPSTCFSYKSGVTAQVDARLKLIKKTLKGPEESKDSQFNYLSKEFQNLYYHIFENAPVKFEGKEMKKVFDLYFSSFNPKMASDPDFKIVETGQVMFSRLFLEKPSR